MRSRASLVLEVVSGFGKSSTRGINVWHGWQQNTHKNNKIKKNITHQAHNTHFILVRYLSLSSKTSWSIDSHDLSSGCGIRHHDCGVENIRHGISNAQRSTKPSQHRNEQNTIRAYHTHLILIQHLNCTKNSLSRYSSLPPPLHPTKTISHVNQKSEKQKRSETAHHR